MKQAMPESLDLSAVEEAARCLERGELIAFPTETVYGLGADAENPIAVAKIFQAKGRPSNHPVIVHLAPEADLAYWAQYVSDDARKLIAAFWPGPLTLIVKRAEHIPDSVAGGQDSIGLRCPSHPVAQALLRAFKNGKGGVAAPSANKFGQVSPTTAQHVRDEFGYDMDDLLTCVLDGGQSEVGIESTIVDVSRGQVVLLRPGHITAAQIADVLGSWPTLPDHRAPRAPGTLESHYAPHTPVVLVDSDQLNDILQKLHDHGRRVALMQYDGQVHIPVLARISLPVTAAGFAYALYAALRTMDSAKADVIVVQTPPTDEVWNAINDRLHRAAHDSSGILSRLLQD